MWNILRTVQLLILISDILAWESWNGKDAERIRKIFVGNANYNLADESDYIDEIIHGHVVRDVDKHERQKECPCVAHFIDPHCGNDMKIYDNGCFFLCAQKRNPSLRLKRWGKCPDGSGYEEI